MVTKVQNPAVALLPQAMPGLAAVDLRMHDATSPLTADGCADDESTSSTVVHKCPSTLSEDGTSSTLADDLRFEVASPSSSRAASITGILEATLAVTAATKIQKTYFASLEKRSMFPLRGFVLSCSGWRFSQH